MIYLDTHVVIWLYADAGKRLSARACELVEQEQRLFVSPMVLLEMEFLHEIGRTTAGSKPVYAYLRESLNLEICSKPFPNIIDLARSFTWTRDPFDRIITAQAALEKDVLITKDRSVLENYPKAVW